MTGAVHTRGDDRRHWMFVARATFMTGYLTVIVMCVFGDTGPCVFWTMIMPTIPLLLVVAGFHFWRRVCPLAGLGALGGRLADRGRRPSRSLERAVLPSSFVVLLITLVLRLVVVNGDSGGLACLLAGLGLFALLVNAKFGGRTWCNYVCPVGVVERIYTDAGSLRSGSASRCPRCTGCTHACPDIDQEKSYDRDLLGFGRRLSFYAFPGLVFGFYGYYALRGGAWDAFFDGQWTHRPASVELVLGPGFVFAPALPALTAATVTLVIGSLVSVLVFLGIERGLSAVITDVRRRRHVVLAIAGFTAFNVFYLFAGQPSLRRVPGASTLVAVVAPVVAMVVLIRRLSWRPPQRPKGSRLPVVG